MRTWVPAATDSDRTSDRELAVAVGARVNCTHDSATSILRLRKLHEYPRALRFLCPLCPHDLFIKRFGHDFLVGAEKRQLRMEIERRNLELLWEREIFGEAFTGPRILGHIGAPHFAIIENFIEDEEWLALLIDVARDKRNEVDLFASLLLIAEFLVKLHGAPLKGLDLSLMGLGGPGFEHLDCSHEALGSSISAEEARKLQSLHGGWISDAFFRSSVAPLSLVHGGMTSVNLNFSREKGLRVVDFETLCVGSRYIDVGTVTAELKSCFHLHGGDSFAAEPYISCFLEDYFRLSGIDIDYAKFTWLQAFFMGKRLLLMSIGRSFDERMRRWLARSALEVWSHLGASRA